MTKKAAIKKRPLLKIEIFSNSNCSNGELIIRSWRCGEKKGKLKVLIVVYNIDA
jgi:hypothetical protein